MARVEEIRRNLILSVILIVLIFIIGSFVYHAVEGWTVLESVYFITITLTTVGYGDIVPKTEIGMLFTIMLVWIGISAAFFLIYSIAAYRESTLDRHVISRLNMLRNLTMMGRQKTPPPNSKIKKLMGDHR